MEPVRPPRQRRSQETLRRFLEATQALLQEKHFDNIAVSEIVERAGSSVGAFYSRFEDKEALLVCLRNAFTQDTEEEARRLAASRDWEAAPLEAAVTEFVRMLVHQHRRHRGTLRALVGRSIAGRTGLTPQTGLEEMISPTPFGELMKARRSEIGHPNPDVAVHLGLAMVTGAVRERILFPELSSSAKPTAPLTDAVLAEELSRAFLGFLGVNTGKRMG
jgi:AcrR family transcriptional regulator